MTSGIVKIKVLIEGLNFKTFPIQISSRSSLGGGGGQEYFLGEFADSAQ